MFKTAYKEFETRLGKIDGERGEKKTLIESYIKDRKSSFSIREIQNQCPGVSIDMIRKVLKNMQKAGLIECLGKGNSAKWSRIQSFN